METKTIVTIALSFFVLAVVVIFGYAALNNGQNEPNNISQSQNQSLSQQSSASVSNNQQILLADLALKNTAENCWVIVDEKVYDVTEYAPLHPAGVDKIIPLCGKDATTTFGTRGGKGPHPDKAKNTLNNYYVGDIIR